MTLPLPVLRNVGQLKNISSDRMITSAAEIGQRPLLRTAFLVA